MKTRSRSLFLLAMLVMMTFLLTACGGPEATYKQAQTLLAQSKYTEAAEKYASIIDYEDSATWLKYCEACALCEAGNYEAGIAALEALGGIGESDARIAHYTSLAGPGYTYKRAQNLLSQNKYAQAAEKFGSLGSYEDAATLNIYCKACALCEEGHFETGIAALEKLGDYKDCAMRITYYTARYWDDSSVGTTEFEWMERANDIYGENLLYLDSMERSAALVTRIETAKATLYNAAVADGDSGKYAAAQNVFARLDNYKDSWARYAYYDIREDEDALVNSNDQDALLTVAFCYNEMGAFLDSADRTVAMTAKADAIVANKYAGVTTLVNEGKLAEAETALASFGEYGNEQVAANYYTIAEKYLVQGQWYESSGAFTKAGDYSDAASRIHEPFYKQAEMLMSESNWVEAISAFELAGEYGDALQCIHYCYTRIAEEALGDTEEIAEIQDVAAQYTAIGDCRDSKERAALLNNRADAILDARYNAAIALVDNKEYDKAYAAFMALNGYKDSAAYVDSLGEHLDIKEMSGVAKGFKSTVKVSLTTRAGVIDSIEIDSSGETQGFGTRCTEDEAFASQFVGKTGSFIMGVNIDALAGATVTSKAVVEAVNNAQGEVLKGTAKGCVGEVMVLVTLDETGAVATLAVDATNETPGLGDKCAADNFTNQFVGKTVPFVIGENIDAVTGATVTSKAVVEAVNKAVATTTSAGALTATAPGFMNADVRVTITLDETGAIATMTVDVSKQVPPVCDMCTTEEFIGQFIGKTGPFVKGENVDGVSGATFTADGVIAAVNAATGAKTAPDEEATKVLEGTAKGFVSEVKVQVTLDEYGAVATLTVDASNETPGLGGECASKDFTNQFVGKTGPFVIGENIDAMTYATITSTAVVEAVNAVMPAVEITAPDAVPADGMITVKAPGFVSDVTVTLTVADGVIAAITVDSADEILGTRCAEDAVFLNQFIGKKPPLVLDKEVDVLAGATITSQAVVDAVNAAFESSTLK